MTIPLTKTAADVFAPTTAGGAPRGASMDEARTWGVEVEGVLNTHQTELDALGEPPMRYTSEVTVAATAALASEDLGGLVKINAASAPTVTLPTATADDARLTMTLVNVGSTIATIQGALVSAVRQPIGSLDVGGSGTSFSLPAGARVTLAVNDDGAGWTIVSFSRKSGASAGSSVVVADDGYLPALDARRLFNLPVLTQSQRTVLKLGTGYSNGGGKAGAVIIASDGWAYVTGATPVNGNNLASRPVFQPLRLAPGEVAPTLPFVKAVRSQNSIYLIDSAGVVYCCGGNASGQLGQGDTTARLSLVRMAWFVTNGITVSDVMTQRFGATGGANETVYFLGSSASIDRGVWAVGRNDAGQLGDGSTANTTPRTTPVRVGSLTGITRLIARGYEVGTGMALKDDGTLYMWGHNNYGLSADGTTTAKLSPVSVLTGVQDFALGWDNNGSAIYQYAMALMASDKTIRAIGYNGSGQHGSGGTTNTTTWVQPSIGFTTAESITALNGGTHASTAVLTSDGFLKLCGNNAVGQQGTGNTVNQTALQEPAFDGQGKIIKVGSGGYNTTGAIYALDSDGVLWAAGYGTSGGLGTPNSSVPASQNTFQRVPLPGPDTIADFEMVPGNAAANVWGVLAKGASGALYALGYNNLGQLGLGHTEAIVDGFELVRL